MFKIIRISALLLLMMTALRSESAPIRVTQTAEKGNPKLFFEAGATPGFDRELRSMLRACGWFDVVTGGGYSDYRLKSSQAGNQVTLVLTAGGISRTFRAASTDFRSLAKRLVDAMLYREFKVPGICRSRIVFCAETRRGVRNLYLCDIDGGNLQQLTEFQSLCVEPVWGPGGKSVIYSKYNRSSINVVETMLSPRRTRILVSARGLNAGAAVSPDGRHLALIMSQNRRVDLYVKPLYGSGLRALTNNFAVEASPAWSPDGRRVCYVSNSSGTARLYEVSPGGGGPRRIPTMGGEATRPAFSRKGDLVYNTREQGFYQLAVIRSGERGAGELITNAGSNYESPSWAPDSRHVVCTRTSGGRSSLWVIDSFTGTQRLLLGGAQNLSMPSWSNLMP